MNTSVFAQQLTDSGLAFVERGMWLVIGAATGDYGWKLHLSSVQVQAPDLLGAVLPVLRRSGVAFKIARDPVVLGLLNEGALGDTQVGKFVTIYPSNDAAAQDLAIELMACTPDCTGPRIVSDRHLGGIVYARYGPFSPSMKRNRLGLFEPVEATAAALAEYTVPFVAPEGIADPFQNFLDGTSSAGVPPVSSERLMGPGYLVTGVMTQHAKGCVFEAIDLRDRHAIRTVALKEGRMHCMSDAHGRAMQDRLANQAAAHARAAAVGVAPMAHPTFLFRNSLFLPIDYVPGQDLGARPATPFSRLGTSDAKRLLHTLCDTARALEVLHGAGVIHRDLSMRNIRVQPDGSVMLLDMEIAHLLPIDSGGVTVDPPLMQGTPGFVSPQQLAGDPASVCDDVYGFGAILICTLTGLDPQRVIFAHGTQTVTQRAFQIEQLSGAPTPLCEIAAACVDPLHTVRPSMPQIHRALQSSTEQPLQISRLELPCKAALEELACDGARWLLQGAGRDSHTQMWQSPDIEAGNHADIRLIHAFKLYRSANVGVAGVVYLLAKLYRHGFLIDGVRSDVERGVDWLLSHYPTSDDQMTGLHFGEGGVAVAIAEALASGLIDPGAWTIGYFREVFNAPIDWPDLTHGAAGQGLGALNCANLLRDPAMNQDAMACVERCVGHLIATQTADGSWVLPDGVTEMSGKAFTGFAHGAAGPLAFLSHPAVSKAFPAARDAAERAAQWLIDEAKAGEGGLYVWWSMAPGDPRSWSWWCHGAPGIAVGLLSHYRTARDGRFAAAARAAMRSHPFEARHANLGQCHGLAGIGEIYLDAYECLVEEEWLERAQAIGRTLSNLARREPTGASWLVENPYVPTPDLMIGTAGVVHFLARLSRPGIWFGAPLCPPAHLDCDGLQGAER